MVGVLLVGFVAVGAWHPAVNGWQTIKDVAEVAAAATAAVACALRARRELGSGPDGMGWALIAIGVSAWTVAQVGWTFYDLGGGDPPAVSWMDAGFLLCALSLPLGLLAMVRTPAGYLSKTRAVLEGLLVALGTLFLSWTVVVAPVRATADSSDLAQILHLAYPLMDVAAVGAALSVIYWTRDDPPPGLGALALGAAALAIADSAFWYWSETRVDFAGTTPFDGAWLVGFLLIAFGAAQASRRQTVEQRRRASIALLGLPACPTMLAILLVGIKHWVLGESLGPPQPIIEILVCIAFVGALLLALAGFENTVLRRSLHQKVADRTAELSRARSFFHALIERASDATVVLGPDLIITHLSDSAAAVFGVATEGMVGRRMDVFGEDAERHFTAEGRFATLKPGESQRVEWRLQDAKGGHRQIESMVTNLLDDPNVEGLVVNSRDVTDRAELEAQLREKALRDPLTNLPNRALLADRTARAFARSLRSGDRVAAIVVDLDSFRKINRSLGRPAGDRVLRIVAERLLDVTRAEDTVAHAGADEFVVLVERIGSYFVAEEAARRIAAEIRRPFSLDGRDYRLSASIGVAVGGAGETDPEGLLANAETAMQEVKGAGRDDVQLFKEQNDPSAHQRFCLESDLRRAIEEGQITVVYQPQFSPEDIGLPVGFEALARWEHRDLGSISPADFIPLAEESGSIIPLGRFMLHEAMRTAADWRRIGDDGRAPSVSINVSAVQLRSPSLVPDVAAALAGSGLDPARVVLEVTESAVIADVGAAAKVLQRLKGLGVEISLDDFGSGNASIGRVRELPFDELKLDRSLLLGDPSFLDLAVDVGRAISLRTVLEGVETTGQLGTARRLGCDLVQGFLLGKPLSAANAAAVLRRDPVA